LFVGDLSYLHAAPAQLQGNHLGDLILLFQSYYRGLVGPVQEIGIGTAAKDTTLLDENSMKIVQHLAIARYPGGNFNPHQPGMSIPTHIQIEKV
jgi:hypothetical protein